MAFSAAAGTSARDLRVVQANPLHSVVVNDSAPVTGPMPPPSPPPATAWRGPTNRRIAVMARDVPSAETGGGEVVESSAVTAAAADEPRASYAPGASRALHSEVAPSEPGAPAPARERRRRRSTRSERLTQIVEGLGASASADGPNSSLDASCRSLLKLSRPADLSRAVPALQRMLQVASVVPPSLGASPEDSPGGAAAVETLCRTLIEVVHRAPAAAAGTAAVVARAMAAYSSHAPAMEQACWLVGDLVTRPDEMGGFLAANGAQALVGVLAACNSDTPHQPAAAGEGPGLSSPPAPRAAAADAAAHTLVAMCSVAARAAGSTALVAAGAVPVVVATLQRHGDSDAAVAEAGCRVLQELLCVGSASARREARRALVLCGGLEVLLQQLSSRCVCVVIFARPSGAYRIPPFLSVSWDTDAL